MQRIWLVANVWQCTPSNDLCGHPSSLSNSKLIVKYIVLSKFLFIIIVGENQMVYLPNLFAIGK